MIRIVASLFSIFLLASCSQGSKGGDDTPVYTLGDKSYIVVGDGAALTHSDEGVSGSGSIVVNDPLPEGVDSGRNFFLHGHLEDGGAMTLVAYSDNKLNGGVAMRFQRSGSSFVVTSSGPGGTTDLSSKFAGEDASSVLGFYIDVHNDEDNSHILVWSSATTDFDTEPLLDSEEGEGLGTAGKGTGTNWGVVLDKAALHALVDGEPKNEHEHGEHEGEHDHAYGE